MFSTTIKERDREIKHLYTLGMSVVVVKWDTEEIYRRVESKQQKLEQFWSHYLLFHSVYVLNNYLVVLFAPHPAAKLVALAYI